MYIHIYIFIYPMESQYVNSLKSHQFSHPCDVSHGQFSGRATAPTASATVVWIGHAVQELLQ